MRHQSSRDRHTMYRLTISAYLPLKHYEDGSKNITDSYLSGEGTAVVSRLLILFVDLIERKLGEEGVSGDELDDIEIFTRVRIESATTMLLR